MNIKGLAQEDWDAIKVALDDPLPEVVSERAKILREAERIVSNDRNVDYDTPERNFARIAALWGAFMQQPFEPHEVAVLLMLVKVARIRTSPGKLDHWVDGAGYFACGGEVRPQ